MFCSECGTQNPDTNQFCKNCGKPFRKNQEAPSPQSAGVPVQPVATPPPAQPVYYPPPPAVVQPVTAAPVKPAGNTAMSALGIGSIILAVLSWFRYPYIFGLLAIVFGGVVLFKSGNKKSWQAILGILGIIAGLACIITDIFYFTIFPIPPLVLT
jgi:hypothetical protein